MSGSGSTGQPLSPAVREAATLLTLWGPCRKPGDRYLACVSLKGKGQCQSIRHLFEGCMRSNVSIGLNGLQSFAAQAPEGGDPLEWAASEVKRMQR